MKMSLSSWKSSLSLALANARRLNPRVALLGIGNELNGDDAAGVLVARRLKTKLAGCDHLLIIEAGPAPENFTAPLRRFAPGLVILVDAAEMDEPPGAIAWVDWQQSEGLSASTHSLPPSVLAKYLIHELDCQVGLLLVQAQQVEMGEPVSTPVAQAVERAGRYLSMQLA
jgi:hydrogenase 3 maturation protease